MSIMLMRHILDVFQLIRVYSAFSGTAGNGNGAAARNPG